MHFIPVNSFAINPFQHENIKKNSVPQKIHKQEVIFVPSDHHDHSSFFFKPLKTNFPGIIFMILSGLGTLKYSQMVITLLTVFCGQIMGFSRENLFGKCARTIAQKPRGHSKSNLNISSPYEQLVKVDCLQFISKSNALLLYLESPVDFNRHV
jgi:Domain of unknown function (DUF1986)